MSRVIHTNTNRNYFNELDHYERKKGELYGTIKFLTTYEEQKDKLRKQIIKSKETEKKKEIKNQQKVLDKKYKSYTSGSRNIKYYQLKIKELEAEQKTKTEPLMTKRLEERKNRDKLRREKATVTRANLDNAMIESFTEFATSKGKQSSLKKKNPSKRKSVFGKGGALRKKSRKVRKSRKN